MTIEQYTDDAVCFAMGLPQLLPAELGDVIRLVCRPSFHPEVCVTLKPDEIVTVGLKTMLWNESLVARMPEHSERAYLLPGEFDPVYEAFAAALDESKRPPKWVVICDGMRVSAVRFRVRESERFSGSAVNDAERKFVTSVLSLALSKAVSIELRNRIAWCGRYVVRGDDAAVAFPVVPEPAVDQLLVTRLLVLGTPEERAEFHKMTGTKPTGRPPA